MDRWEMYVFTSLLLVVISVNCILCLDKTCKQGDMIDVTKAAQDNFQMFIVGNERYVPKSDPLFLEQVIAELPSIKYIIKKASFKGLRNCRIATLRICRGDDSFFKHMVCPRITFEADYEVMGFAGEQYLQGRGYVNVDRDNYNILFTGFYETYGQKKLHVNVTNYDYVVRAGNVSFDAQGLFGNDETKTIAAIGYLNEYWFFLDSLLARPVLKSFFDRYFEHKNLYFKAYSIEAAFGP